MKKYFLLFAAAALCLFSCDKVNDNKGGDDDGDYKELVIPVNVQISLAEMETVVELDGQKILDFFGMTELEFYKAMGTWDGDQGAGATYQEGNIIQFGIAEKNDKTNLKFVPATSNNFGHWVNAEGGLTWWTGQEEQGAFCIGTENWAEYGLEDASEDLPYLFVFGVYSWDEEAAAGVTRKLTEVYYYEGDEDEPEKACFIEWNISYVEFQDPEAGKYDPSKRASAEFTINAEVSAATGYEGVAELGADEVKNALQLSTYEFNNALENITVTNYVNGETADNTAGGIGGNWLDIDGNVCGWGADAIVCVEFQSYATSMGAHVCTYAEEGNNVAAAVGKTYNYKQVIALDDNGTVTTATINYVIKVVE